MNSFQDIQNSHLALTQYYRWYQVYEIPFTQSTINNQLDTLDEEVEIISQAGIMKGKASLPERLKMYEGWQNAHHVKDALIKQIDENTLSLEADILYQNIRPDNNRYSYTIHYSTFLKTRENNLPLFNKVEIQPTGTIENPEFESAYEQNRAKSFLHYWLYCMETPKENFRNFKELFDPHFTLHTSTAGIIDTFEKFETWLTGISQQIKTSAHEPKNLKITPNNDGTILVIVDFDWKGITTNNEKMIAKTHHEWVLSNNTEERFARMKEMKVTQIIPFQIVANF